MAIFVANLEIKHILLVVFGLSVGLTRGKGQNGGFPDLEEQALKKLRPLVIDILYQDYMKNDWYLVFWLRASSLDIAKSEKMLRKAHQWRNDRNIDTLISQDYSKLEREIQYYIDGHDREGRPIICMPFGTWNLRKVIITSRKGEYNLYIDRMHETAAKFSRDTWNATKEIRKNRDTPDHILLADMNGYNLRSHGCLACVAAMLNHATDFNSYYPDLTQAILLNAPRVFETALQLVRQALSEKANKVLQVYGTNKEEWAGVLNKIIDPGQLRPMFGGTRRDSKI